MNPSMGLDCRHPGVRHPSNGAHKLSVDPGGAKWITRKAYMNVSSKVPVQFHGVSVLTYLAQRFTYLSESGWQALILEGRIALNGALCIGTEAITQGDCIRCELPDFDAPIVNFDYDIVYQDEWLLGINKPSGLRVHSGGKFVRSNLIYHLRQVHQPAYPEANLVHRLDADTSGIVLLAREKRVLTQLVHQFAEALVEKKYLAVISGHLDPANGTINLPIGPVENARVPRFGIDQAHGKPAVTHYTTLRQLSADYSLVELQPATGRTHQLRVHLAAMGHPLAGDLLYTMNDSDYLAWRENPPPPTGLQRQALHSHQLQFLHPIHQTSCTLTAPMAADIAQFIQKISETKY